MKKNAQTTTSALSSTVRASGSGSQIARAARLNSAAMLRARTKS